MKVGFMGFAGIFFRRLKYILISFLDSLFLIERMIHLSGSPVEMGTQYGTLLKPQLQSLFAIFDQEFMIPNIVIEADSEKALVTEHAQTQCYFRESDKGILASTNFFHTPELASNVKPDKRLLFIFNLKCRTVKKW